MDCTRFVQQHMTSSRYYGNSDSEFEMNENKNTKRKTETDMRIFLSYLVSINESREPEKIPADELDCHLATYFSVIKKHDGNEYEPASLRGMLCSIERYLRSKNYPISLTRDAEFTNTRNMLKERQKILRELVKTEKITKTETLASNTVNRLNQLYLAKEFGPHNPSSVINALCFVFVVNLKIRKAIDHKQLLWGDILLKVSASGEEYLCYEPLSGFEYSRLPLKGISGNKVMAQNADTSLWDPISIYKLYRQKRPQNMMSLDSPFYLGIAVPVHESLQQPWFKSIAMGVNKLNDLVRMIRDLTGSLGNSSNHLTDVGNSTNSNNDVSDELPVSVSKYHESLVNKDVIDEGSNDSPLDMSPTALNRPSNIDKAPSEVPTTANSVQEADVSIVVNNEFDEARDKIQNILDGISEETKTDVLQWLCQQHEACPGSGRRDKEVTSSKRKRLRVTLELNNEDIDQYRSICKVAKIQVLPDTEISENAPVTYHKASPSRNDGNNSPADDFDLTDENDEADDFKEDNDEESNPKHPNEGKDYQKHELQHSKLTASPDYNQTPQTSAVSDTEVSGKVIDIKHPLTGYNPYTAWALDPRFAMFMRNGFIQTYQDFVNIYNNTEHVKKSST